MLRRPFTLFHVHLKRGFAGGDIVRAPGSFSKKEHAQEEQYFRQKEREELQQFEKEMTKKKEKAPATNKDSGEGKRGKK